MIYFLLAGKWKIQMQRESGIATYAKKAEMHVIVHLNAAGPQE